MNELTTTQRTVLEAAINHLNGSIHPLPGNLKGEAARKVIKSLLKKDLIEEDGPETWRITETGFLALGLRMEQAENTDANDQPVATEPPAIEIDDDTPEAQDSDGAEAQDSADGAEAHDADDDAEVNDDAEADDDGEAEAIETRSERSPLDQLFERIALDHMFVDTLETQNSSGLDFHNVSVWGIRSALEAAYEAGVQSHKNPVKTRRQPGAPRQPRTDSKQAKVIALMQRPEGATLAQIAEATGWMSHTIRAFISTTKKKGMEIATNHVQTVGPNKQGTPGSTTTYFINP
ncbi:hypothetical protein SIID45300_02265 [Candidatus Magnetaquicoccaceae bacterium FCR-1]|uniref:DUF6900 domain-containing protein n=1 Tax=Candidatus Magnetaquiglobus chichijimensis TaxID=3141448 RepID=A0ABQ0CAL3_9PROT